MKNEDIQSSRQEQNETLHVDALRIALTTCDNIFEPGGVSTSITRIARGLSTHYNARVDILMLNSDHHAEFNPHGKNGITRLQQGADNITVYQLAPWTGGTSQAQHQVDMHYALLELARERQYDLMQAFYASITGFPTVYAAQELNIPSIVSIRGNDIIRDVFQGERFPYLKWALENATQFTAVSQEGLHRAQILSASPHKGRVILNSIRPQDYAEGTQDLQLPRPVIGSLAVFKNKKGLEVLLCAFSMLLQHYPTAHLLLAGFIIPGEQQRFDTLVAKYNLSDKITLTGRVPKQDALRYLRGMDVFAFTSLHDGCPNTVLEAMLAGTPIVATRAGAVPELIENGKHGLLVQPGSATELRDALLNMLDAAASRQQYGKQAKERVLTQFAPHRELTAYWEVYQECLSCETRPPEL
jgi:glycosyltransferase involved in cell wall biosynthesis